MRQPAAKQRITVRVPAKVAQDLRARGGLDLRTFIPSSWDENHQLQPGVFVDVQSRERLDSDDSETFISVEDRRHPYGDPRHTLGRLAEKDAVDLALFILANVPPRHRRWSRA